MDLDKKLEECRIKFNNKNWITNAVQQHFDIKKESFKDYFTNKEDYNQCIKQLKKDLEQTHNVKLKL